jgi:hypothetical protein
MSQVALAPQGNKRPYMLRKGIATAADLDTKPLSITSATVTLNRDTHAGRLLILNRAAGIAVTLPAATGTGDTYRFHVLASFTGAASIKVASASDEMQGNAVLFADGGATVVGFSAVDNDDTIDMFGTANSTGGLLGAYYELQDIASGFWRVAIVSDAGGTEATPFSATVS